MRVVLTMMVRDEVDIVAATIEHHLAQGVDHILVTDNASVDGTRDILADYAKAASVTVFDDPEHRKQQGEVVTRMARLAATDFGANWVINGDADEFVRSTVSGETVADRLSRVPRNVRAFTVPVVNVVGPTARAGNGIASRLHWRDERSIEQLHDVGLHAHPTPNTIHVGSGSVTVSQGNHFTSITATASASRDIGLEVVHLPWRSWSQFERKTINMGRGYEANPDLIPSPNHHGMRDWRRWQAGTLLPVYIARTTTDALSFAEGGFRRDSTLLASLQAIDPILPERFNPTIDPATDVPFTDDELAEFEALAAIVNPIDAAYQKQLLALLTREHALLTAARSDRAARVRAEEVLAGSAQRTRRLLGPLEPLVTLGPARGAWSVAKRTGYGIGRLLSHTRN